MKAVVFQGVGKISLENVKDPSLKGDRDAIVRLTKSAICGTDLHLVRGTMPGVKKGTILGHEGVGAIEQVGSNVQNFKQGDRVIIPSTICCGDCYYCKKEIYAQCDNANPNGPLAGTAFYGGPAITGPFAGLQAEKARVPFADACLIALPDAISDEQAILLSDVVPTAYMAVELADVQPDDTVAVFGCGPIGQLAIACLKLLKVGRIIAIDRVPSRLALAKQQGAEIINFDEQDPVKALHRMTEKRGPSKVIDAVGIDAQQPACCAQGIFKHLFKNLAIKRQFRRELKEIAPKTNPHKGNWRPGNGPSQVLDWAVTSCAKAGTVSIIGVYTPLMHSFPIGSSMGKNLTLRMGNCNHRKYIPMLLDWVKDGRLNPLPFITQKIPFSEAIDGYKHFDRREDNWIKVVLNI